MVDNRKTQRYSIHWRCALVVETQGTQETIQCRTIDASSSGFSVICHRNISPPHTVTIHLLVDSSRGNQSQVIVEAQGRIANNVLSGQQGGFRLGVEFTKFSRDGKQVLEKYLPKESGQSPKRITSAYDAPLKGMAPVASKSSDDEATRDKGEAPAEGQSSEEP